MSEIENNHNLKNHDTENWRIELQEVKSLLEKLEKNSEEKIFLKKMTGSDDERDLKKEIELLKKNKLEKEKGSEINRIKNELGEIQKKIKICQNLDEDEENKQKLK
jgi:hypothetical protein